MKKQKTWNDLRHVVSIKTNGDVNINLQEDYRDFDVTITFPNGKIVCLQLRPSNGSLDIILPDDQAVNCFLGDDLSPAPALNVGHFRLAKQLITDLP